MPLPALHGRLVQVDDKTVIAPKLSLRGGRRPTWRPEREARGSALGVQSREGTAVPYRLPKKRTDAIGAYHFNGSLFVSAALCRERHAAPLQRHVRLAIVPPNLQSPWCFLPAKGTLRPFFTKKFEKSRKSPCGFCLRVVYFHFVDKKSFGQHRTIAASTFAGYFSPIHRFEKLEVHKVHLHFSNLVSTKNLPPNALAESCVAALDRIQNRRDCLP